MREARVLRPYVGGEALAAGYAQGREGVGPDEGGGARGTVGRAPARLELDEIGGQVAVFADVAGDGAGYLEGFYGGELGEGGGEGGYG